jgi:hypothetical protein
VGEGEASGVDVVGQVDVVVVVGRTPAAGLAMSLEQPELGEGLVELAAEVGLVADDVSEAGAALTSKYWWTRGSFLTPPSNTTKS